MNQFDPRVKKTLQSLDRSLIENLNSYDFRKITVDMICRNAKVNRSTFYKYYTDKYDLLDSYLLRVLEGFKGAISSSGFVLASPYTVSGNGYMEGLEKTIDYIYEHLDVYRVLWKASIGRSVYTEMEDLIRDNILHTAPEVSSDPEPDSPGCDGTDPGTAQIKMECYRELYARLFASNFMTLIRWWLSKQPSISRNDVMSVMEGSIRKGLLKTLPYAKDL